MVDFKLSQRTALTHLDTPKTEKFYMSGSVKFDEKSQIVKPAGNYPYYFLEMHQKRSKSTIPMS